MYTWQRPAFVTTFGMMNPVISEPKSKVITVTSNYKETNGEFAYLIGGPNIADGKRR